MKRAHRIPGIHRLMCMLTLATVIGCDGDPGQATVQPIAFQDGEQSRLPNLAVAPDGSTFLSLVGKDGTDAVLRLAHIEGKEPPTARDIASGSQWFLNWADFPSLAIASDGEIQATFLEKTGSGAYDYRVRLVTSTDGGESFAEAKTLHDDEGAGEHGFVSLIPTASDSWAVWLDGRNTTGHGEGGDHSGGHGGQGAMALMARRIGAAGELLPEVLLDDRVCDCCQTTGVAVGDTVLVAYRDRGEDETRDISLVRIDASGAPEALWSSEDHWVINGCPVNGPALAAEEDRVAIVWYTLGEDGRDRVLCSQSRDGGDSFSPPLILAGQGSLGRVDATFDRKGRLFVSWLEETSDGAAWMVGLISVDSGLLHKLKVTDADPSRKSGFAHLAPLGDDLVLACTDSGSPPHVNLFRIQVP